MGQILYIVYACYGSFYLEYPVAVTDSWEATDITTCETFNAITELTKRTKGSDNINSVPLMQNLLFYPGVHLEVAWALRRQYNCRFHLLLV